MRLIATLTLATLAGLLAACTTNPVTGRRQLMLLSEDMAIKEAALAYTTMMSDHTKKGQISADAALRERVTRITRRLIPHAIRYRPETASWQWETQVIDEPKTLNAWCMAGGKMAIYTGLIQKLNASDDEIAQVMGHEIAHALSKHTVERMSYALATNLGVLAVGATSDKNAARNVQITGMVAAVAIQLPNSREAESESDRIGIELAARAGYHPDAAVSLWKKMTAASGDGNGKTDRFDFLSTHPAGTKRIEALAGLAPQMMPYYESKDPRPVWAPPPAK